MSGSNRQALFDKWAADYDRAVSDSAGDFPFDGYDAVLSKVVECAMPAVGISVLDVGVGTSNLASRFVERECEVWGVDFSGPMVERAKAKTPQVQIVQADVLKEWPAGLPTRFDRIVSAYVFHEFDLSQKIDLLRRLTHAHLQEGGRIVVGDISFPSVIARAEAADMQGGAWDEGESYWAADETLRAIHSENLTLSYEQVSSCGGVYVVQAAG